MFFLTKFLQVIFEITIWANETKNLLFNIARSSVFSVPKRLQSCLFQMDVFFNFFWTIIALQFPVQCSYPQLHAFAVAIHPDLSQSILIYHNPSRSVTIHLDLSQSILICHNPSRSVTIHPDLSQSIPIQLPCVQER